MIEKWNAGEYGTKDDNVTYKDMWGVIQEEVAKGWFVPSKGELVAFLGNLGVTSANYAQKGLSGWIHSSSLEESISTWSAFVIDGYMFSGNLSGRSVVRLGTTF